MRDARLFGSACVPHADERILAMSVFRFSAKGAHLISSPGQRPRIHEAKTSALKARFTAEQVKKLDELRFQRLLRGNQIPGGDAPG